MSDRKPRGLFVNPKKAQCSIYESGRMMYECLLRSERYDLDWREIDQRDPKIQGGYDFYAFNYHHVTMGWLDLSTLARLGKAPRFTFVLEVNPGDPFVLCPKDRFDAYLPLDPSLVHPDPKVFPFPRPVEPAVRQGILFGLAVVTLVALAMVDVLDVAFFIVTFLVAGLIEAYAQTRK